MTDPQAEIAELKAEVRSLKLEVGRLREAIFSLSHFIQNHTPHEIVRESIRRTLGGHE